MEERVGPLAVVVVVEKEPGPGFLYGPVGDGGDEWVMVRSVGQVVCHAEILYEWGEVCRSPAEV